eukprot:CAMPEP_0114565652 /NCGR_PEP_ID=MMETSP0114-20121206/14430_1 /TAXON_ID=31324 /ORGANISM="Goniomonas sp, Strain m" /LENGTH=250 /DNA_ID=CAMNT_0001751925 /DNA_START=1 /DNA_END=750 /DNA_ORIENTATION=+
MGIVGLNVADTITAAVRGNREFCAQMNEKVLRHFVAMIVERGRHARFLRFLDSLVFVEGEPMKRNQDLVLRLVLDERSSVIDIDGDRISETGQRTSRLELLLSGEHLKRLASVVVYHATCVDLLAKCAEGKCPGTEVKLRDMVTWDHCVRNILDLDLRPDGSQADPSEAAVAPQVYLDGLRLVRAPFVRLLLNVHINTQLAVETQFSRWWPVPGERSVMGEFVLQVQQLTERLEQAGAGLHGGAGAGAGA